jgi:hypothetical protein
MSQVVVAKLDGVLLESKNAPLSTGGKQHVH